MAGTGMSCARAPTDLRADGCVRLRRLGCRLAAEAACRWSVGSVGDGELAGDGDGVGWRRSGPLAAAGSGRCAVFVGSHSSGGMAWPVQTCGPLQRSQGAQTRSGGHAPQRKGPVVLVTGRLHEPGALRDRLLVIQRPRGGGPWRRRRCGCLRPGGKRRSPCACGRSPPRPPWHGRPGRWCSRRRPGAGPASGAG